MIALAVGVGALFAVGSYLVMQRPLTRIVIGFALLGHGTVLLLLASGGRPGRPPLAGIGRGRVADPLPQAFALTAIVISFGLTAFLLALAYRSWTHTGDDEVEDDVEDRRIARLGGLDRSEPPARAERPRRRERPGRPDGPEPRR